jgi:cytoskeletal protein CcmA (bactofilin family)
MLRSQTLFGKRLTPIAPNTPLAATGGAAPSGGLSTTRSSNLPDSVVSTSSANSNSAPAPVASGTKEVGSKLIVGPNIKLKGVEITDCDTLVVEGRVEATMDSRVIQIAENGAFKGAAGIDIAEIHGEFDGELTARDKLVIYATGKVSGKIRYGKIVIEEGGQLSGDVRVATESDSKGVAAVKLLA